MSPGPAPQIETLIEARWVVPVRPSGTVLEHHAIAIDAQGRIAALLPTSQARAQFSPKRTVALPDHVVTPGLVNIHAHSAMTLLRGIGDDLPLMDWLQKRIWPLETALVSEQFVYDGTRLAALEMLRSGFTCCSDMYFYPQAAGRALRDVGLRAAVGVMVIEFPTPYASDADDYLRKGLEARDALIDDPRVSFTLAPHAPYTISDATFGRMVTLAEELDAPIHMHVHETQDEIAQSLAEHGCRPLARLERLGVVSERLIAVHAVHLTADEIELLAARASSMAHCPASNLKLASGIAPVTALLKAGVNVAIGTDGAASNNRLDGVSEMRLAALLAKGASGDAQALPAMQALECATLAGARALGLEAQVGSIEVGKQADLAAFDLRDAETQPCFDPISHVVYACGREQVSDVWVGGDHLMQGRAVAAATEILAPISAWQNSARLHVKPLV